ncbi:methylthioribose kinase [Bacillus timonensis]|nr:methylthioribose kinase [Bacillus timonensis]
MIQRFIELGEGYSDIYELIELTKANKHRVSHLFALHTTKDDKEVTSLIVALQPTRPGDFQALYICREGIPNPTFKKNKRFDLFQEVASELGKVIIQFDVQPSNTFAEKELYYQYLIGILRLNHYIPQMK